MTAFRVFAGLAPHPAKIYAGDDVRAALEAFLKALPKEACWIEPGRHAVTGEPLIAARDVKSRRLVVALYGITEDEWRLACELYEGAGGTLQ